MGFPIASGCFGGCLGGDIHAGIGGFVELVRIPFGRRNSAGLANFFDFARALVNEFVSNGGLRGSQRIAVDFCGRANFSA